jgi:hypothetical protein
VLTQISMVLDQLRTPIIAENTAQTDPSNSSLDQ